MLIGNPNSLSPAYLCMLCCIIYVDVLQMDIQNKIRDILSDTIQQDFMGQSGKVGEEELLHKLKQQGLVDDILHQLQFRGQQGGTTPATHFLDRDDKVTHLPTKKGRCSKI
jgi:hypothetical protein